MNLSTHLSNLELSGGGGALYAHKLNKANIALCFALFCFGKGAE